MRFVYYAALLAAAISTLLIPRLANGAVPASLSYQGYLTDADGSPIDGDVNIEFRIYTVDLGGVEVWFDSELVVVDQGLFSVELGGLASPFPPGMFDTPLYVGVTVVGDTEMLPRRPLTTVGFAFKADDALTLTGQSAVALNQGEHVIDTANPHAVNAAQAGAASSSDIADLQAQLDAALASIAALQADLADETTLRIGADEVEALARAEADGAESAARVAVDSVHDLSIATIEANTVLALHGRLILNGDTALLSGSNLQIVNGMGASNSNNGLGNLVIGYDEPRLSGSPTCSIGQYPNQGDCESNGGVWALSHKSGSHNLVVGPRNSYSSFGGLVAGVLNTVNGPNTSVSGGYGSVAGGQYASVSGGINNEASNFYSSVSGGSENVASGQSASVSGGRENTASGKYSSVGGGDYNVASHENSSVAGGSNNTASGKWSVVTGGILNTADNNYASVSGGWRNTASGPNSSVSGGEGNTADGISSSVSGGQNNTASGDYTSITGGSNSEATDSAFSVGGGASGQSCPVGKVLTGFDADGGVLCVTIPDFFATQVLDDDGNVGEYTSIALIPSTGDPIISYYDRTDGDLKVAYCYEADCSYSFVAVVDNAPSGGLDLIDVGRWTSIAVSWAPPSVPQPYISYYDRQHRDLKVAACSDQFCSSATLVTVDGGLEVGEYTSIAIGTDGYPVISYYDATNDDLKMAHCQHADCNNATLTTVDTDGTVGLYTSIAIGTDGYPVISYYDATNDDVKMAHCQDADCNNATLTTVDTDGTVGLYTSIAIGTDGYPVISYYDATNNNLKMAHCQAADCSSATVTTVDAADEVGEYTSIAIGADGYPVISYHDRRPDNPEQAFLKMAECHELDCSSATLATLDSTGRVGEHSSITIGTDGFPIISYYDRTNGALKAVRAAPRSW